MITGRTHIPLSHLILSVLLKMWDSYALSPCTSSITLNALFGLACLNFISTSGVIVSDEMRNRRQNILRCGTCLSNVDN